MEKKKLSNLTDHQRVLLEMLKDFDAVCQRHGIKYQLFAGTALAVWRLLRCNPWSLGGVDYVPDKLTTEYFKIRKK